MSNLTHHFIKAPVSYNNNNLGGKEWGWCYHCDTWLDVILKEGRKEGRKEIA
jgi:hypothetical protein